MVNITSGMDSGTKYNLKSPGAAWRVEISYRLVFEIQHYKNNPEAISRKANRYIKVKTGLVIITFHGEQGAHLFL